MESHRWRDAIRRMNEEMVVCGGSYATMDRGDARTCWAIAAAIVVGFLWHLKSKREGTWARLSSQDLINRVIKFNPKIVKKDAVDDNGCYGCDVRRAYIFCGKFGICFENVCTYTGMRDDTVFAEPNENEVVDAKAKRNILAIMRMFWPVGCMTAKEIDRTSPEFWQTSRRA